MEYAQDTQELLKMVSDMREALRAGRFSAAGSRSRNVKEAREARKQIARILTEIRSRELAAQAGIAAKAK